MTIDMPEEVFAAVRKSPAEFVQEMRLIAAVKWYELEQVSQGRAAEIAGVSRADFLAALGRFNVTPYQYSAEDALREAERLGNG
jgi:predicted HTH domain antitoxin